MSVITEGLDSRAMLLVHSPVVKACEPPGGPARLAGALRRNGIRCAVWDANIEGQMVLVKAAADGCSAPGGKSGTWLRRASGHLDKNIELLQAADGYVNNDRYRRAVMDVNHLLAVAGRPFGVRMSLADYHDEALSPLRSADLLLAAKEPERNPFYGWFSRRLPLLLKEDCFQWIGFSLNYLSQALTTFAMIGFLRREYPNIRVVVGGGLATSWMRSPGWKNPFDGLIDEIVAGPGELPLLEIFGCWPEGNFSQPDYGGFPVEDYLSPGFVLPYSASGGCWWRRCTFCPEVSEKSPYLPIPPAVALADLRALVGRMKPRLIHMLDNALSPALLEAVAANPPGVPWYGFARIDARLADPVFCRKLRDSGCVMLKLGIESGDQEVLDALQKGITLPDVSRTLKNLKNAGIAAYVYLLFGTPAENVDAAKRTLSFVEEHANEIDFLNLAIFNLPADSQEAKMYASGEFYEGDLSFYRPFVHPQGWSRCEVRRFLDTEFKRNPLIAGIVRRDPPFFTSNHAPFLIKKR
jgi:hypothetical protein